MQPPGWCVNAPEVPFGSEWVFESYWNLDSERSYGFGSGPIPRSAIVNYARDAGLDEDEESDFVYLIRVMDQAHLEYNRKKLAKDAEKDG